MAERWPDKVIIGLTGNIATGKSTVMQLAAEQGALTIDADKVVHQIMDSDPGMQAAIAVAFGDEVRLPDGRIDRQKLGAIVFNDAEALNDLEQMLHPAVRQEMLRRIDESDAGAVMIEAIHLLKGGLARLCNQIWVTRCHRQRRIDRLVICRGMDPVTAVRRVDIQPPQETKVAQADVVIDTNATLADTEAQFHLAWSRLPLPPPAARRQRPTATPAPPPATKIDPEPMAERPVKQPPPETGPVTVRRARPSDIPAVLLLIRRATNSAAQMGRTDLLHSLSERSYFIGQSGTEINAVVGWSTDNMIARIDRIYVHPLAAALVTGPAVLAEIEKSANELLCEIILAFPPTNAPAELRALFGQRGYRLVTDGESLPRVWQTALAESQPEQTLVMMKVLRDRRIA